MKSKVCVGKAVKVTADECEMAAKSVPTALKLKLYDCATELLTVTVKGAPPLVGVSCAGLAMQFEGAPLPQVMATELAYPFTAVSVPLNTADEFTCAVKEGFVIASV